VNESVAGQLQCGEVFTTEAKEALRRFPCTEPGLSVAEGCLRNEKQLSRRKLPKAGAADRIRTNVRSFPSPPMSASSTTWAPEHTPPHDTRFDRRLSEILDYATEVFADK